MKILKKITKKVIFLFIFVFILSGCNQYEKVEQTRNLMGTFVKIVVYDKEHSNAITAMEKAFRAVENVNELMSTYIEESEISQLNKNGHLDSISPEFAYVLSKAEKYSDLSNGAFDITVKPLLELYKNTFKTRNSPPNDEELAEALKLVDYRNVILKDRSVKFKTPGCMVDLGGIAKGYAIDQAIEALETSGINYALVNAGGDIRALGTKPDGKKWKIALQNPRDKDDFITKFELSDKAVATSGDYERYFNESKSAHHIINPKTGKSATELISVTVIAQKAIDADALATTVFVLGEKKGLELINKLENTETLIITSDRRILSSDGFDK